MSDDKTIIADPSSIFIQPGQRNVGSLIQYNGANLGKRIPLKEARTSIGRTPEAHLFISEVSISRQHAEIISNGGYAIIVQFEKNKEKKLIEKLVK